MQARAGAAAFYRIFLLNAGLRRSNGTLCAHLGVRSRSAGCRPAQQHLLQRGLAPKQPVARLTRLALVVAELERALLSASDPKSPSYGKWLSSRDVQALTVGDAERSRVLAWLARAGGGVQVVADEEKGGSSAPGFVAARLTVAAAEKLLQTKYGLWEHKETGKRVVRLVDNCKDLTAYLIPAP